jgi:hypothetical protein
LLINGRIKGLHVGLTLALKYLVGHHRKLKEIITWATIVADDRLLTPEQEKLAYCLAMMAGSGLKSAKKKKFTFSANKLLCLYY